MGSTLTPYLLLALLAGGGVGGGLVLFVAALVGWRRQTKATTAVSRQVGRFLRRRAGAALVVGLVVLVVMRWPVAAIAAGLLVMFWSSLFGGAAAERVALARVEALATWTESLRDTIASAAGLEQAIGASARTAGDVLGPYLVALDDRIRSRMSMREALHRLAADLDDGGADMVIAALIQASELRGEGLREVLTDLANDARAKVAMRNRVFASRAGTRRSVQIVVGVIVVMVVGLRVFNPAYTEPFGTVQGQAVLAVVFGLFAFGLVWLQRLARVPAPNRFLVRASTGGAA
ncbi:type II secretion system F family protein [Streptomyces sp. NRRL B-24484]|uniref:type II secretion system F family protein n=1 Tax=Streptomyces sp. NRRL B-24484 TaxID=1463833 RepID=UPI000694FEEC|nr:type II secretion system F family protein [Streptomyces sp. NRRL B-24484]